MIFKGEPNMAIMKPDGTPRFKFDENGLFDTTVHAKEYEDGLIKKLENAGFEKVIESVPVEEIPAEEVTAKVTPVKKK